MNKAILFVHYFNKYLNFALGNHLNFFIIINCFSNRTNCYLNIRPNFKKIINLLSLHYYNLSNYH